MAVTANHYEMNYLVEVFFFVSYQNCSKFFGVVDVFRKLDILNFIPVKKQ